MAVALVVAVVAVAYGTAAPQLGVAEFAPAARNQPEPPPTTAGDHAGSTSAEAGGRRATTTTAPPASATTAPDGAGSAAAPTTRVSRSRACVGSPPRQTEDPHSPSCMATIFEGENGGATSRGVSSTEIRVAVPMSGLAADSVATIDALFEHFNQRFEFYGRRLVPVYIAGSPSDPLAARSMVTSLVEQGIFAAMTGVLEVIDPHVALPVEFARQGVVTIVRGAAMGWSDRTLYDQWHPYAWSVYPSIEDVQANLADLACSALVGKKARFAADATLQNATRRFGVIAGANVTPPAVTVLTQKLAACSGEEPERATVPSTGELRTAMERMKAKGVTTMFCICADQYAQIAMQAAHPVAYYPEWIINPVTWAGCENECWLKSVQSGSKVAPPIMLNAGPRLLPVQARPFFGIVQPVLARPGMSASTVLGRADLAYASLLALAAGIQGAGPNLTPETFGQALMAAQFPNPGAGLPPYWQGGVGFGPGDHSFYDDYSIGWWSDDAEALEVSQGSTAKGSWCFVDQAARFRVGAYTPDIDSKLFNRDLPCR